MTYLLTFLGGATLTLLLMVVVYVTARITVEGNSKDLVILVFLGGLLAVIIKMV